MEEVRTYIFQRDKKKTIKRFFYNFLILLAIGGICYMFYAGVLGIGLGFFSAIFLIVTLIRIKIYQDKYVGITAYGERKSELIIAEEYFVVDKVKIPFSELEDLIIYVDEYTGKPRNFIGVHHGGNNEIRFIHKGKKFSINYIIWNKSEFIQIEKLVDKIEQKQKLSMASIHSPTKPTLG